MSAQILTRFGPFSAGLLVALLILGPEPGLAMSSDDEDGAKKASSAAPITAAREHVRDKAWTKAIEKLEQALADDQFNPETLNLLGFSHRQLAQFDEALTYYQRALKVDPQHLGANEYLGELYLKTGRLDDAIARLQVLDDACFLPCKEYAELKDSIEKYKARIGVK